MSPATAQLFELETPAFTEDFTGAVFRQLDPSQVRNTIEEHHYLHSLPSTKWAFGFYLDGVMAGAMAFGTIPGPNAKAICGAEYQGQVLELTRLFIHDWAGKNAESRFLGAVFKMLTPSATHQGGTILLSYADTAAGHVGTIYQATNWIYTGMSKSSQVVVNGEVVHQRTASNIFGSVAGLNLERVTQSPKHRYVYFLGNKTQRKCLRKALRWSQQPYPKQTGQ
jgi:hypothetical protein